jgi:hypothetical protein
MKRLLLVFALPLTLVTGCSSDGDDDDDVAGADAGFVPEGVTYYQDVKPILDGKCARCHTEGGIAPFALLDYSDAKAHAGVSMLAINDGIMPPWKAEEGCNDYAGDFSLTDSEIAIFNAWVEADTPEGDPANEGDPIAVEDLRLSRVDVALDMPEPYAPVQTPDDYRCFVIEWPAEYSTTQYISGFKAVPGNDSIVHHVIAFLATPDQASDYYALDAGEDGPGYTCFGGPRGPSQEWIGGWAPGGQGFDMPPNTGMKIEPGSLIILQVHYNTLFDDPIADVTGVELKLDSAVDKEVWTQPWANPQWLSGGMNIPANDDDVMHSFQFDLTWASDGKPVLIHSAGLHLHNLGTSGLAKINRGTGGGEDCLVQIDDWDFKWQDGYSLKSPVRFDAGDQLYLECHWDNSVQNQVIVDGQPLPPQDVNWGDGSTDEMCLGVFLLSEAD